MSDATPPLRIAVIANKTWECEPLVSVLTSKDGRPISFGRFVRGYDPAEILPKVDPLTGEPPRLPPEAEGLDVRGNPPIRPRLSFPVGPAGAPHAQVEVWCIEDWMRKQRRVGDQIKDMSSSSSWEKFVFTLPRIRERAFGTQGADLVIAFGTAGIPADETFNGCVAVGSNVYINDPWDDAPADEVDAQIARFGPLLQAPLRGWLRKKLTCPRIKGTLFSVDLPWDARYAAEARFLEAPIAPARPPRVLAGSGYASLGTINICDYDDYVWADDETRDRFRDKIKQREIGSMETTHGLIRLVWHDTPFLFVSGLTDRVPYFNAEVTPRKYSQNFAAAHNAGVALAQLLPELGKLANANALFDSRSPTILAEDVSQPVVAWPSAPLHQECPDYARGETPLDCPWAGIARALVAAAKDGESVIHALRARAPKVVAAIENDRESAGCLDSWGQCLNFDEYALSQIVDPAILAAISEIANLPAGPVVWHAGLTHTYGYLFSLLHTQFGYKRARWVNPAIAAAFGLHPGTLGPTPEEGTLLANATWFFGHIAFAGEALPLQRLASFEKSVPDSLRAFKYHTLRRRRLVETLPGVGDGAAPVKLRTDLVELPKAVPETHLLVYSIEAQRDGARLVSAFPVGPDTVRNLFAEIASGQSREVRTRYNAYVEGVTRLGSWEEVAFADA